MILLILDVLGTIDYVSADGTIVFRTCDAEKDKVVFQMVSIFYIILFCDKYLLSKISKTGLSQIIVLFPINS